MIFVSSVKATIRERLEGKKKMGNPPTYEAAGYFLGRSSIQSGYPGSVGC